MVGQSNSREARRSSSSKELWDLHHAAFCGGRASAILTLLATLWLQANVRIGHNIQIRGPSDYLTRVTLEARPSGSSCRLKPVAIKVMLTCMEKTMWIRIFQQIPNDKSKFHFPELKAFSRKSQGTGVVLCILGYTILKQTEDLLAHSVTGLWQRQISD